ncbi:MAG: GAF domain-containing protein [Candidatus Marinimicrobia bacterium]|nr:GAF domain-containing protein [Candidatus Neomarinimicrobiota bacterium]MCF7850829.1 GAF domain-containing protein [Candidatus Neomarinimicrobiota bacterium]MCF7904751.1 GAF domain-containing protein [Candidatus Neomarinimicrobiota bacterium]
MKFLKRYSLPIVVFVLISVIGGVGINYIMHLQDEKLQVETNVMAEQAGIRLYEFLNTRIARLEIFRESLENRMLSEAEFRTKALLIQHELSGFQAINWIDANGTIQWVTPLSKNLPALGVSLLQHGDKRAVAAFERAQLYRIDMSTVSVNLIQSGLGFATYFPVIQQDNIIGFVNGVFRIEQLIDECYGNSIHNFNYEVLLGGKRVYLRGEEGNFNDPIAISRYNFILLGQSWELQIAPGSSGGKSSSLMDVLALTVTIVIALLVALITLYRQRSSEELAQAYKYVEDSRLKFRTIFDHSPACLLRFDQNGVFTDWNRHTASLFGFEFPPHTGKNAFELEAVAGLLPAIEKALNGENDEFYGFVALNGKNVAIDAHIESLVSGTDMVQGGIVLLNDVTEQNQVLHAKEVMYEIANLTNSEKELPKLFESIHKSLGRVLDTKNFYVALFNEETNEFSYPYYQDEFDSAPPTPIKDEKGLSAYTLKNQETVLYSKEQVYELNRVGKIDLIGTPSEQWLGASLIVEGKPIGIMAVQSYSKDSVFGETDIEMMRFVSDQIAVAIKINLEDTKLRESEIMHRELSIKLGESNDMKALLLDIISHDLKNPASVISGMADLLVDENSESEEMALIKDSSDALLKIIENTSSLARITLGEEIKRESVDLSEMLLSVIAEFSRGFEDRQVELKPLVEEGVKAEVNPIISEVFRNYLSNAFRYGPKGEQVTCGLKTSGDQIEFYVTDRGQALTVEEQNSLFHRRVQLGNRKKQGSGLGLAIVKRIADAHGAQAGIRSGKEKGNTFYLKLPILS